MSIGKDEIINLKVECPVASSQLKGVLSAALQGLSVTVTMTDDFLLYNILFSLTFVIIYISAEVKQMSVHMSPSTSP